MKNILNSAVVALVLVGSFASAGSAMAQVKHKKLKTAAAGVAGYEVAKHSHSRFLKKHKLAAGVASAVIAHHYMKKKSH